MKKISLTLQIVLLLVIFLSTSSLSQEFKPIKLPDPQTDGGKPLMNVLKERRSSRAFATKQLSPQMVSNLLWAAYGINRPGSGKRTAPSARNWQETDIYLANTEGLYLYDAKTHSLNPVLSKDIRAETGKQDFVAFAPINLIYVADFTKMGDASSENKAFYSAAGTGFISQNVYLFCASEGLATVVRGSVARNKLARIMKLEPNQKITLAQTVGYPADSSAKEE